MAYQPGGVMLTTDLATGRQTEGRTPAGLLLFEALDGALRSEIVDPPKGSKPQQDGVNPPVKDFTALQNRYGNQAATRFEIMEGATQNTLSPYLRFDTVKETGQPTQISLQIQGTAQPSVKHEVIQKVITIKNLLAVALSNAPLQADLTISTLTVYAKGQLLTTPAGDQIVFVSKNGKDAAGELQAMLEGVRSLSRTEANAEQIDAAQALLTEYAFFSPEVTQKRLLSLISMGRPATNHAEPKNLERAIDFLVDNAADGLRLVLASDRAMCGSCQLLVDQLAWLIQQGRFRAHGQAATDIQVLTAHGSILDENGNIDERHVSSLTNLNLQHAVRFLEIIYNRIDPRLRMKYLVPPSYDITAFPAGSITEDFAKWFKLNYGVNLRDYFYWNMDTDEIHLTQTGIETCFNAEEYDPSSEYLSTNEPWLSLYYYQYFH